MVLCVVKAFVISLKSPAASPLVFMFQAEHKCRKLRVILDKVGVKKTENFESYTLRQLTLLSLDIFSSDWELLKAIKGGSLLRLSPCLVSLYVKLGEGTRCETRLTLPCNWCICHGLSVGKLSQIHKEKSSRALSQIHAKHCYAPYVST